MLKQISVFSENRRGTLEKITGIFTDHAVNIDAMIVNDSAEFGVARFIVDKPEEAARALQDAGFLVKTTFVLGVFMEDGYGELHKLLKFVQDSNVNLDYMYVTFDRTTMEPVAILKTSTQEAILENILQNKGYRTK